MKEWIDLVKDREGCEHKAYWDKLGNVWTIGWGHTGPEVKDGLVWTQEQCDLMLNVDLAKALTVAFILSPSLKQASPLRQWAIGDFCYNVGPYDTKNRIRYQGSTLRKRVAEENWAEAAKENLKWTRAGGQIQKGLVTRRTVTSKWLLEG